MVLAQRVHSWIQSDVPRLLTLASPVCYTRVQTYSEVAENTTAQISRKLEPYTKKKRPKSWPQIQLRLAEYAARHRPTSKNRLHWDRRMAKQEQIAKDAWTRRENSWRNEQKRRAEAEQRWQFRQQMAEAEANGQFLFQSEHAEKVEKVLEKAKYSTWQRSKRKKKSYDPAQEELKREDDQPVQAAPTTPRLNRDL